MLATNFWHKQSSQMLSVLEQNGEACAPKSFNNDHRGTDYIPGKPLV